MMSKALVRNGWSVGRLVVAAAMVSAGIAVTADAWQDMFGVAVHDQEATHILLVPAVFLWLFWVRRRRLRQIRPRCTFVGPALVMVGWAIYSFGDIRFYHYLWYGGAIVVAIGCLVSVLGKSLVLRFLPAFLSLVFLIPVPGRYRQRIAVPMETAAAKVTQRSLEVLGTPIERSGNILRTNGVDVTVSEACNGLRMVFSLVLVSYAFAFGSPLRNYVRALILLASPVSAIFCNVLRLVPTVWVYGHSSSAVAGWFHDINGWIMLAVSLGLLAGLVRLLQWALLPVSRFTLAYD